MKTKVLFDEGTPILLREFFPQHPIDSVNEMDWGKLGDEELVLSAEKYGYTTLVTTDLQLKYQYLPPHKLAIVVLTSTSWPRIQEVVGQVVFAVEAAKPGSYTEVAV